MEIKTRITSLKNDKNDKRSWWTRGGSNRIVLTTLLCPPTSTLQWAGQLHCLQERKAKDPRTPSRTICGDKVALCFPKQRRLVIHLRQHQSHFHREVNGGTRLLTSCESEDTTVRIKFHQREKERWAGQQHWPPNWQVNEEFYRNSPCWSCLGLRSSKLINANPSKEKPHKEVTFLWAEFTVRGTEVVEATEKMDSDRRWRGNHAWIFHKIWSCIFENCLLTISVSSRTLELHRGEARIIISPFLQRTEETLSPPLHMKEGKDYSQIPQTFYEKYMKSKESRTLQNDDAARKTRPQSH